MLNDLDQKLITYYFNLLAKKDYSEGELRGKALSKGYETKVVEEGLLYLKDKNFLNEKRLVENLINYYGGKKGKTWLKQKMSLRQIKPSVVEEALSSLEELSPNEDLRKKVENKYRIDDWQNLDFKIKQKVLSFLARQGFSDPYRIVEGWKEDFS